MPARSGGTVARFLIPGQSGAGKSSLTAWFVDKGFAYLTDELAVLTADGAVAGFSRALMLKRADDTFLSALPRFASSPRHQAGETLMLRPEPDNQAPTSLLPCGLIIFPSFTPGADLTIRPLTSARACIGLMGCNVNSRNLRDGGFAVISGLARRATAVELNYGAFGQLDHVADMLARLMLDGGIDANRDGDSWRPSRLRQRHLCRRRQRRPRRLPHPSATKFRQRPRAATR